MKNVVLLIGGCFFGFVAILTANTIAFAVGPDLLKEENPVMGKVFMEAEFLDEDILKVEVMAAEMKSPIVGNAFHLNYGDGNLVFLRYEPGEFLERGGDPFYLVKDFAKKEVVIFGETLRRDDSFPMGSGKIAAFYFQIIGEKRFNLRFSDGVISTVNTVRQDLDRIIWEDLYFDETTNRLVENEEADGVGGGLSFWTRWSDGGTLFTLIGLALCVSVGMIFLVKKTSEKSVNFK